MANFAFKLVRAALSTTIDVGSVVATTSVGLLHRFQVVDVVLGSDATPADNAILWEIQKRTATGTSGTTVTGSPLDEADTFTSTLLGNQGPSINGAGSGTKLSIALNQRATFRWIPAPGREIVSAATAGAGYAIATPTAQGTPQGVATLICNEL